jgi:hypothetical protein
MAAAAFRKGELPGLIVEDSANGTIYVLSLSADVGVAGVAGAGGGLTGLVVRSTIAVLAGDGVGPIFVGDFNGDGNADFIVNGQDGHTASVYLGHGDGTFETPVRYGFDHGVGSMAVGDVDRDWHADLLVEGEDGGVEVFHGNADGSFAGVSEGGFAAGVDELGVGGLVRGAMVVADVDGDGCADVMAPSRSVGASVGAGGGGENALYVWYGRCDGTFGAPQVVPLERSYSMAAVRDLDGDGLPDVALSDGAVVSVIYGLGKRSFGAEEQVWAGVGVTSLVAADVNGDGAADLVVSNGAATLAGGAGAGAAAGEAGAGVGVGAGGITVLLNTDKAAAATGSPTTTMIYLCVGPTLGCPSTGYVMPPYVPTLTMIYGQTYNGTAVVTDTDGTELSGDILFYDDYNGNTTLLCTLVADVAGSCPPTVGTGAMVGTHVFTGMYAPGTDTVHAASTSSPVTITVTADTTAATGVGSPNPAVQGQPVTLTATVTGSQASSVTFVGLYVPPSGTVVFKVGTTVIGTGTLAANASGLSSTATLTTTALPVGTDTITVTYGGDLDFSGTSASFTETVTPVLATMTTLTSSLNPSYVGQSVTFTATVALVGGGAAPVPTGTVTFADGGVGIGTGVLNGLGVATFTTTTLTLGHHNMTASASGDTMTGPSTSGVLEQVVEALPPPGSVNFSIAVTPDPVSIGVGEGVQLSVTVTPLNGFLDGVNLSCAGLPTEATCQFLNAAIAPGGGTTTVVLGTTAPHSCGTTQPYFLGGNGGGPGLGTLALPVLAGVVALFVPGRRRWLRGLMAMAAVAAAMQMTGCGNCTDLGTRPGVYTVQVVGSSAGTSEVEGAIVGVTVTI